MVSSNGKTITREVKTFENVLTVVGGFFISIYAFSARSYKFFFSELGLLKAAYGFADENRFKETLSKKEANNRKIIKTICFRIKFFIYK